MNFESILWFLVTFVPASFIFSKIMSRGKAKAKNITKRSILPLITVLPLFLFMDKLPQWFTWIFLLCFVIYFCIMGIIRVYKGLETPFRYLISLGVFAPLLLLNNVSQEWVLPLILINQGMFVLFIIYYFKNPSMNGDWIEATLEELSANIKKGCPYSSKPIIVEIYSDRPFITGIIGLRIWVKKNRTIIKISKKRHLKLGCPDLESFSKAVAEAVVKNSFQNKKAINT